MPLSSTLRATSRNTGHARLAVPLAGLLLCALAGQAQAFGWQQKNQISAATGANATATYEIAKGLTYTLDSECREEGNRVVVLTLDASPDADTQQRAKYLPPHSATPGQAEAMDIDATFDQTSVTNPWPAQVSVLADGTTRFHLRFDKQRYFTRKVERLFESSQYLNLKHTGQSSSEVFTTSVPLIRLKSIFGKVIACPPATSVAGAR